MTTARLRLLAADLDYPDDLALHTAASGRVPALAARYLEIRREDGFHGVGEVRANVAYLTGLDEATATAAIGILCERVDWSVPAEDLLAAFDAVADGAPATARAVVESAILDGLARMRGVPVAALLGGDFVPALSSNQCLFWGPQERFETLARRYLDEGFREIKVRIAIADFDQDLARLRRLREICGPKVHVAADANASWGAEEAARKLGALAEFDLAYVEQPTTKGDWVAFDHVLARAPMPLMLDENLATADDLERLLDRAGRGSGPMGHLKIAKMGSPRAVTDAARRLKAAGIGVMIGQMNEGAMATAITAHCAMAARPDHAELYGCYGLLNDPAAGLAYRDGALIAPEGPGLALTFDAGACRELWSREVAAPTG